MTEKTLDSLVKENQITSYEYENLDEESRLGVSKYRNTERLILNFPNGKNLVINTFCSGCNENTSMIFSENVP